MIGLTQKKIRSYKIPRLYNKMPASIAKIQCYHVQKKTVYFLGKKMHYPIIEYLTDKLIQALFYMSVFNF